MSGPTSADISAIQSRMAHDFPGALSEAEQLVDQWPRSALAHLILAFVRNFMKDLDGAIAELEKVLELDPGHQDAGFNLGVCLLQRGAYAQAAGHLEQFSKQHGEFRRTMCLELLANAWAGDLRKARELVNELADVQSTDPVVAYLASRLAPLGEQGDRGAVLQRSLSTGENRANLVSFINRHDLPWWRRLDDKAELTRLVSCGRHGARFSRYPETYVMPQDRKALLSREGPWIAKRATLFGGQSLVIAQSPTDMPDENGWIVQRYVDEPLLVDGRKAHLRLFVVIASVNPLRAWLYGNGTARFAPLAYVRGDYGTSGQAGHVTNSVRYKNDAHLSQRAQVLSLKDYLVKAADTPEHSGALSGELLELAMEFVRFVDGADIVPQGDDVQADLFLPKLLGLDVLFDSDGHAWLLEVERYPALSETTRSGQAIQAQLINDTAQLFSGGTVPAGAWIPLL